MSNQKSKTENKKKRPAWVDMYAKTQKVDARMNESRYWKTDVPNIKLSRAFVVVLILHVVAVGGILAFEMFKAEPSGDVALHAEGMAQLDADQPAGLIGDGVQQPGQAGLPVASDDGLDDGYLRYIVQRGDNLRFIADAYKISRTELLDANNIDERHPLVQGRILRIPRALLSLRGTDPAADPAGPDNPIVGLEEDGDNGFIPLKSFGAITGVPVHSVAKPEVPLPVRTGSLNGEGFLPLGDTLEPRGQGDTVSKVVKRPDRPRVLRERPSQAPIESKRATLASSSQHTVVGGDTLYGISRKYGVSVNEILGANPGVTPRTLRIGKTLRIP